MEKRLGFVIATLILVTSIVLVNNSTSVINTEKIQNTMSQEQSIIQSADLVSHEQIEINNNEEFASYASTGDGSLQSPYIIENFNITVIDSHGIFVEKTTKHFIIRNCWITTQGNSKSAIFLNSVAPGTAQLRNNICVVNWIGISIYYSDGVIVENNTCSFNTYDGIQAIDSNDVTIRNNICNDNERGIEAGFTAIHLDVVNNTCMRNYYGIRIVGYSYSRYTKNYLADNNYGFECYTESLYWCNQSYFTWNKFVSNTWFGLRLEGSYFDQGIIQNNWFIDNYAGYLQAMDDGTNNLFEKNYWNSWTSPDLDNNGIVDSPYILAGSAGNGDYKPLVVLYEPGIYFSHNPIIIDGDTDLNNTALLESWFGNGSASNPYMIQQYQISTAGYAISISNTNYFFTMQNCECVGGLYLSSVSNGQVTNNHFTEIDISASGMAIFNSVNCNISRNFVQNAYALGIQVSGGSFIRISENLIQDSAYGVMFYDCSDSVFCYNNIVRTSYSYYGLDVNVPISTIVMYNNYVDIGSIAAGSSEIYSGSGFDANQGYNWYSSAFSIDSDLNNDGFVDTPHYIAGGYYDYYPLTSATTMNLPIIQNPTGGSIVSGNVMINWKSSLDLWNHPITYALYYSYESSAWINLAAGLTTHLFLWNTATVADGYYRLMIVAKCTNGIGAQYVIESSFLIKNLIHQLLPPHVTYPNGGETIAGTITVTWDAASDSWGDSIHYKVYYWMGETSAWQYLGQTDSTYIEWSTNGEIPDRTDYLIRVVVDCSQGLTNVDDSDNYFTVQNTGHSLSTPQVLYPNGGETLSGTIDISWIGATDALGDTITYSVYYSSGSSSGWVLIGSSIGETHFLWDTLLISIPDRQDYTIKVHAECSRGQRSEDTSDNVFTLRNKASENPFASISGYDTYLLGLSFLLIAGLYIFFFKKSHH